MPSSRPPPSAPPPRPPRCETNGKRRGRCISKNKTKQNHTLPSPRLLTHPLALPFLPTQIEGAESEHLADFWSKFETWKWNCTHKTTPPALVGGSPTPRCDGLGLAGQPCPNTDGEIAELEASIEGAEPEWLMTEWVNKMMAIKHKNHTLSAYVRWATG